MIRPDLEAHTFLTNYLSGVTMFKDHESAATVLSVVAIILPFVLLLIIL
jgi:hypothetical protein